MHEEYVPPPFPDRINALNGTDSLPARIIDLRLWVVRLTELKERASDPSWNAGSNPYLEAVWLQERIKLYGRRIKAEQELLHSDSQIKHWQSAELPYNLR